jgi:hypothetical protein
VRRRGIRKPPQTWVWSGTAVRSVKASADGGRLAVLKANFQTDIYIGQLEANGTRMKTPRCLTLDESNDRPGAWMPDSTTIIFSSDRNGSFDIFRQAIDKSSAEPLVTGPDDKSPKAVTPDGAWIVYAARKQGYTSTQKLMRVPVSRNLWDNSLVPPFCCWHLSAIRARLDTAFGRPNRPVEVVSCVRADPWADGGAELFQ